VIVMSVRMSVRMLLVFSILVGACEQHDTPAPVPTPTPAKPPAVAPVVDAGEPRGEVIVEWAPPKPGTSSTVGFDAKLDLDMNFGGMAILTSSVQKKKKKVQIVAVEPDGTVLKRITYLVRDTKVLVDGEPRKDVTPIRGKTYLVSWKAGTVTGVLHDDRKPATEEEVVAVRKEEAQLHAPDALGAALSGMRFVEGEPFEVPIAVLEKMIQGTYKPKRVVLTYRGKTPEGSQIDAEGVFTNEGEGTLRFNLELKGTLLIDHTGWCREAKVTGQVRAELNGSVVGSGAGSGTVTATPLR